MMLPQKDGWAFLRDRNRDPALLAIAIIIVTSLHIATLEWATGLGAQAFLRKPVEIDELIAEIHRLG
jgi:CheY-like chemotaxis protein